MNKGARPPCGREEFVAELRAVGARAYHDKHPLHVAMNAGDLAPEMIRSWIANRFYYQQNIPRKDAAILANCPLREVRRIWLHRITDHDGDAAHPGGIEAWLRLGEASGMTRAELLENRHLLPAVRFAVDAYVQFARTQPWPVAIASSLTELFAPDLMAERLRAFEQHYTWIAAEGFEYFRRRLTQARTDSEQALALTIEHCDTSELQDAAVAALAFKCDVLWAILDAIEMDAARHGCPLPQSCATPSRDYAFAPG
jgi:pyrroloquinoline-quinone synthase